LSLCIRDTYWVVVKVNCSMAQFPLIRTAQITLHSLMHLFNVNTISNSLGTTWVGPRACFSWAVSLCMVFCGTDWMNCIRLSLIWFLSATS